MLRRSVLTLALVGLAACEFPTEPPKWDQTWVVPADSISIGVADLLPESISLNADSTAFEAEIPETRAVFSLSSLCPPCAAFDGVTVAKPEFNETLTTTSDLPADVVAATLTGGSVDVILEHNLSFDPLRPSTSPAAPRGYMLVRVTSSGNLVAYDSISGDDRAFPAGTPLTSQLAIRPVEVANNLGIEVAIYSPDGDPTQIDASDTLGVTVPPATVQFSDATVALADVGIDPITTTMDFGDLDATLVERIQSGALLVDVTNPLAVTGTLDVRFEGGFPTIQRSMSIREGAYADSVTLNGTELQAILASESVDVVASGTASATGGTVTVTPTQRVVLETQFRMVVLVGPTEDI